MICKKRYLLFVSFFIFFFIVIYLNVAWAKEGNEVDRKPLIQNEFTPFPSISDSTGLGGEIRFEKAGKLNFLKFSASSMRFKVPDRTDVYCPLCAEFVRLGPNACVPILLFEENIHDKFGKIPHRKGLSVLEIKVAPFSSSFEIMTNALRKDSKCIVSGNIGGLLKKEGKGFRLLEGEAYLIPCVNYYKVTGK